jgi:hypothetical protein
MSCRDELLKQTHSFLINAAGGIQIAVVLDTTVFWVREDSKCLSTR